MDEIAPDAFTTHEVLNQPPPLEGYNLFEQDRVLVEALEREGGGWARGARRRAGRHRRRRAAGVGRLRPTSYTPVLRTHDRYGHRIDEVEYHPAWHQLMRLAVAHELHALPWRTAAPRRARRARRAVLHLSARPRPATAARCR